MNKNKSGIEMFRAKMPLRTWTALAVARWQCHGLEHIAALFWLPLIGRSDADVRNCACPSLKCVGVSTVHSGEERGGGGVQWRGNENVPMLKLM